MTPWPTLYTVEQIYTNNGHLNAKKHDIYYGLKLKYPHWFMSCVLGTSIFFLPDYRNFGAVNFLAG